MSAPKQTLGKRLAVAMAAVGAVFTGACVHDWQPTAVGKTLHRKGYRPGRKTATPVAEACVRCGEKRAGWVVNG